MPVRGAFYPLGTSNFHGFTYVAQVFCYYCKYAASNLQVRVGTKPDSAFSTVGFSNWKKAVDRFKDHVSSSAHTYAFTVFNAFRSTSVNDLMLRDLDQGQSR